MNEKKSFIKCESKFIILLLIGIVLLNISGFIFQDIFNSALLISISMSGIVFIAHFIYFIYGVIKFTILKKEYECLDIKKRVTSWLSSLI